MGIYPKMKYKPIEQCQPGDLVRLAWGSKPWAFIAKNQENDSRLVVLLSDFSHTERNGQPPLYVELTESACQEQYALCYGKDWRIEINQDIEKIKFSENCSREPKGALFVKDEQHFLLADPFDPRGFGNKRCIDLTSGFIEKRPIGSVGVFLSWSLSLHMGGDRFEPLLSFPVRKEV